MISYRRQSFNSQKIPHLRPSEPTYLPMLPFFTEPAVFFLSLLLVLLMVSRRRLCSARLIAENRRMLRMTREMHGTTCTKITRNLDNKVNEFPRIPNLNQACLVVRSY